MIHWRRSCRMAAAALLIAAGTVVAQTAPLVSHQYPMPIDSGLVQNKNQAGLGQAANIVYSNDVRVFGAPWLRLKFDEAVLSGMLETGEGSYLIITSVRDGGKQRLDAKSIKEWSYTSAYFNGDAVHIDLYAFPGTGVNRIKMSEVTGGEFAVGAADTICGNIDDRTLASFPGEARIMSMGCTGWMIDNGNFANRFLTAGHCFIPAPASAVVQFNVPLSTAGGSLVNPPPEHQYAVDMTSVQATQTVIGNDFAQFFTFANSNTGLHARQAQGGAAYTIGSAPAVAGQTLRVSGYGTCNPNDPTVGGGQPLTHTQVQTTHTGAYTLRSGTRLEYTVDTTGGNSGSPIQNGTSPSAVAIGIHTNAGCTTAGGANSGTAIQNAGLQAAIASPTGTGAPYVASTCAETIFASNNGGSAGGAVYFDVSVAGTNDLEITHLWQNVAFVGTSFDVAVYVTPGTSVGKEGSIAGWTQVATGSGVGEAENTPSLVALSNRFTLLAGKSYGIAIRSNVMGHEYTDGTGANQVYTNSNLSMTFGSASNVAFSGAPFSPRVWNGRLCYRVQPASGQCLDTIFAQNNEGSLGGAVYFNANVSAAANLGVTGVTLNAGSLAAPGTAFTLQVYTKAGTFSGFEQTPAAWTLRATGSGVTAAINSPTTVTLNNWFELTAGSNNGVALVLSGAANHTYTNGTGGNQNYSNANLTIATGSSTNGPFSGGVNTPRVFNGSLCYGINLSGCNNPLFRQDPPNANLGGYNSNNATGVAFQQIADDFAVPVNSIVRGLRLWAVYTGNNQVPPTQAFTVNIYANVAGNPGAAPIYTATTSAASVNTGIIQTGFSPNRNLYQFDLTLPDFAATAGTTYWLSPLGNTTDRTWCWQFFTNPGGTIRYRNAPADPWTTDNKNMSFDVCADPACYANCDGSAASPVLTANDFQCFLIRYAANDIYANCDGSTSTPVLTANDFQCFLNAYAAGCP